MTRLKFVTCRCDPYFPIPTATWPMREVQHIPVVGRLPFGWCWTNQSTSLLKRYLSQEGILINILLSNFPINFSLYKYQFFNIRLNNKNIIHLISVIVFLNILFFLDKVVRFEKTDARTRQLPKGTSREQLETTARTTPQNYQNKYWFSQGKLTLQFNKLVFHVRI